MADRRRSPGQKQERKYDTGVSVMGTCCVCGRSTRTPFVPRDPDAVLCDECYVKRFGRPPPGTPPSARGKLHEAVCAECGEPCEIPWKPSEERPAVCWNCRKGVPRKSERARLEGASRTADGRAVRVKKK